jgi:hypothetical protein
MADLGDEPLDRADAGEEDPVADQPSGSAVDEEARPVVELCGRLGDGCGQAAL